MRDMGKHHRINSATHRNLPANDVDQDTATKRESTISAFILKTSVEPQRHREHRDKPKPYGVADAHPQGEWCGTDNRLIFRFSLCLCVSLVKSLGSFRFLLAFLTQYFPLGLQSESSPLFQRGQSRHVVMFGLGSLHAVRASKTTSHR